MIIGLSFVIDVKDTLILDIECMSAFTASAVRLKIMCLNCMLECHIVEYCTLIV